MASGTDDIQARDVNVRQIRTPVRPGGAEADCGAYIASGTMERFVEGFEKSTRRWEIVVYPAMFAFILLAIYGFYLIYNLTRDLHLIAENMAAMNSNIATMRVRMDSVDQTMGNMSTKLDALDPMLVHIAAMETSMQHMDRSIQAMDQSTRAMSISNDQMRQAMQGMNYQVGRPMSIMNSFMPW